jgi:hypothetical protein
MEDNQLFLFNCGLHRIAPNFLHDLSIGLASGTLVPAWPGQS